MIVPPQAMATRELRPQTSGEEHRSPGMETPQASVHLCLWVDIVKVRVPCQDAHYIANLARSRIVFEAVYIDTWYRK